MRSLLALVLLLNGCGFLGVSGLSIIRVRRHFKKDFACSEASMDDWQDGARVEGCGMVAFYWCDGGSRTSGDFAHHGRATHATGAAFKLNWQGDTCALDHAYSSRLTLAPDAGLAARITMDERDESSFRAAASFDGGRIELWTPRIHREFTLAKLSVHEPLSGDVSFTRDGSAITIIARQQVAESELHVLLPSAQLQGLDSFAVQPLGHSYALQRP